MSQTNLTPYQIIEKKKHGQALSQKEINWFITSLVDGSFKDYQAAALLMSIYFKGMNNEEIYYLTKSMMLSGHHFKFKGPTYVDKHSTGGIGDKTTFIVGPIATALGIKVPMIAGRGLGFTGGTVDKIESIPGFKTSIKIDQFQNLVQKHYMAMIGQTKEMAPADGILYSLRDVTATIDSIPLVTSSILSKKLAEGSNGLVMDIKIGSGSFMETKENATKLAKTIIGVMKHFKKKCTCIISDMSQPLGMMSGNSVEVIESIQTLKGQGPKDLLKLSVELAANMALIANKASNIREARKLCMETINSGKALSMFHGLVKRQGGNTKVIDNYDLLPMAKSKTVIKASQKGYLHAYDAKEVGYALIELGGGRKKKSDKVDPAVAIVSHKKVGDKVDKNEPLFSILHHDQQKKIAKDLKKDFEHNILAVKKSKPVINPLIVKTIK